MKDSRSLGERIGVMHVKNVRRLGGCPSVDGGSPLPKSLGDEKLPPAADPNFAAYEGSSNRLVLPLPIPEVVAPRRLALIRM